MQTLEPLPRSETTIPLPDSAQIRYYLFHTQSTASIGEPDSVYSLLCVLSRDGQPDETSFFYDVSRSRSDAEALCRIIEQGAVPPYAIGDILEDWLADPDVLPFTAD